MHRLTAVLVAVVFCLATASVAAAHYWPRDNAKLSAFISVRDRCIQRYGTFCRQDLLKVKSVSKSGAHTLKVRVRWAHTVLGAGHITSTCSVYVDHFGGVNRHC